VSAVRPYLAVMSAHFRTLLQYRAAAVAGFGTQLFWGLIRVMIFGAFYASGTGPQPMSLPQVITYVWLGQAMLLLLPWNVDAEVRAAIRTGTVAYELLRPADLYGRWYCRALAARTAPVLLRAVPMFVVAGLWLGLQAPPSFVAGAAWAAATLAAVLLSAALSVLVSISLFWTLSGEGISRVIPSLTYVLGGLVLPLPLFPDWAQAALRFLPFSGMIDVPFRLYMGHLPPDSVFGALGHQLGWTAVLVLVGRWLLARAAGRVVVQGG
jgi:ABC-2 type transport system permease protein